MPRPPQRPGRPASRPGQTRGGRRGQLEAFERRGEKTGSGGLEAGGTVEIPSVIRAADLAELLRVPTSKVVGTLFSNGIIATINHTLDFDTAAVVATDLGFEVRETGTPSDGDGAGAAAAAAMAEELAAAGPIDDAPDDEASLKPRPPVVTIMGHVDHGKTSLLDAIRKTKVAAGEAGGITQHIGAYQVEVNGQKVTFLDTPGHEAFTAMRARGAQATDVAIIVVAADDGVMPQTKEAVEHAKAAGVPIIVAINKVDLESANPDRVKQELTELDVVVTDFGGSIESVPVSARTGQGLDSLLETILLVAEAEVNPKANPDRAATGTVVESKMDKFRGPVATLLVQKGTLHIGDALLIGNTSGKVKALFDDHGQKAKNAPPSFPVEVLGLSGVPSAGDRFYVVADEKTARARVEALERAQNLDDSELSADALFARIRSGAVKQVNLVVKADVQGSVEPLVSSVEKLTPSEGEARAKVIRAGLGNVNITDVNLAIASGAVVVAFNVKVEADARKLAETSGINVREYSVIYGLVEEIQAMLEGTLEPKIVEVAQGQAEVLATFKAGRRIIAGCKVTDGAIHRRDRVRVNRGTEQIYDGPLESLKRFKDDAAEVREGFECGILLDGFDDLQVGDIMAAYSLEKQ
jgi:translation initiation factor IF-2